MRPNANLKESESIKFKLAVHLKHLSNVWRTLEMPLSNCRINLILTWSSTCIITNYTGAKTRAITGTKLYIPVVTFSTQDNAKILQQLKSVKFKAV